MNSDHFKLKVIKLTHSSSSDADFASTASQQICHEREFGSEFLEPN